MSSNNKKNKKSKKKIKIPFNVLFVALLAITTTVFCFIYTPKDNNYIFVALSSIFWISFISLLALLLLKKSPKGKKIKSTGWYDLSFSFFRFSI